MSGNYFKISITTTSQALIIWFESRHYRTKILQHMCNRLNQMAKDWVIKKSVVKNYCGGQRDSVWYAFFAADEKKDLIAKTCSRQAVFHARWKNIKMSFLKTGSAYQLAGSVANRQQSDIIKTFHESKVPMFLEILNVGALSCVLVLASISWLFVPRLCLFFVPVQIFYRNMTD